MDIKLTLKLTNKIDIITYLKIQSSYETLIIICIKSIEECSNDVRTLPNNSYLVQIGMFNVEQNIVLCYYQELVEVVTAMFISLELREIDGLRHRKCLWTVDNMHNTAYQYMQYCKTTAYMLDMLYSPTYPINTDIIFWVFF